MATFTALPQQPTAAGWNPCIAKSQVGDAPDNNPSPEANIVRPVTSPAAAAEPEANIVRFRTDDQRRADAERMDSEKLADHVASNGWGDVLLKLVELKPYIEVLWERFDQLDQVGQELGW